MALILLFSCLSLFNGVFGCGTTKIAPVLTGYTGISKTENAVPGSWPWHVSLLDRNGVHFCSGALINRRWVLTAASCCVLYTDTVVLGEYDTNVNAEVTQHLSIARVYQHPEWNYGKFEYDIALIQLATPAVFRKTVSAVCLAKPGKAYIDGHMCVTTGWDMTRYNVYRSTKLQQILMPLLNETQCMGSLSYNMKQTMLCAGAGSSSHCLRDLGAPLVYKENGTWTLIGILVLALNPCSASTPLYYSRVASFDDWFNNIFSQYSFK